MISHYYWDYKRTSNRNQKLLQLLNTNIPCLVFLHLFADICLQRVDSTQLARNLFWFTTRKIMNGKFWLLSVVLP